MNVGDDFALGAQRMPMGARSHYALHRYFCTRVHCVPNFNIPFELFSKTDSERMRAMPVRDHLKQNTCVSSNPPIVLRVKLGSVELK